MDWEHGLISGHIFADTKSHAATCARMIDTLEQYPMADGAIMDGPEWGYEIAPHHMKELINAGLVRAAIDAP